MILLLLVLASGVFGWIMQVVIPRWMLGNLPQETILNQIDDVSLLSALENRQMLTVSLGGKPPNDPQRVSISNDLADDLTPADRAEIWKQYTLVIEPFLLRNAVSSGTQSVKRSPIRTLQKTQDWFKNFRESCSASAGPILDSLQGSVEQRLQFDAQRMAHAWLHRWIAFHAGISVTLGVLLIVHIIQSLRYM